MPTMRTAIRCCIRLALLGAICTPAHAATIFMTADRSIAEPGEKVTFDLWVEIGPSDLIRGVQATFEFDGLDPSTAPVFTQVPDLLAGAVMAPWGLSSTIAQAIGDPANVVTVIQANATDQSLAALAGVVGLGLVLLNDNALPLGSVELTAGSGGPVLIRFVEGRDQLCSNVAGNCVIENLGEVINPGVVVAIPFDDDQDGVDDRIDNCPTVPNLDQADTDADGVGDACNDEFDADGDEFADALDNCPADPNPAQLDADGDGVGNACNDAFDDDGDEFGNPFDNCPDDPNPDQADADGDGIGDACNDSMDLDGDEIADSVDNCPEDPNLDQSDRDGDGVGDTCDPFPDDLCNFVVDDLDACRVDLAECESLLEQSSCGSALLDCEIELFDTQGSLATTSANLDACDAALATSNGDLGTCQTDLASCDSQRSTCTDSLVTANDNLSSCESALGIRSGELLACEGSLATCDSERTTCAGDLVEANDVIAAGETEIAVLRADLAAAEAMIASLQARLGDSEAARAACEADQVADLDGDGQIQDEDNCPWVYNPDQDDGNADGIGDACGCGDVSGDGAVNSLDARLIQRLAVGILEPSNLRCAALLGPAM